MKYWDNITPAQQIERWENVLRVLRALTPHQRRKHWNMSWWGEKTECGTVACAAGHCGLDPWFRRRGFRMDFERIEFENELGKIEYEWNADLNVPVSHFFGREGSGSIFLNGKVRPVSKVIEEVKAHIRQLKEEPKADEAA